MCTPLLSGVGLLNKAAGGKIRPLSFLSPAAALMTGGLTKKKPDATQTGTVPGYGG